VSDLAGPASTGAAASGDRTRVVPFVTKLWTMVNAPATDIHISWSASGNSFVIPRPDQFASEVLPKFFKHNQLSSFSQQLSTYGFVRVPNESCLDPRLEYTHKYFQRQLGMDVLPRIKRSTRTGAGASRVAPCARKGLSEGRGDDAPVSVVVDSRMSPITETIDDQGGGPCKPSPASVGCGFESERGADDAPANGGADGVLILPPPKLDSSGTPSSSWVKEMGSMLNELEDRFNKTKEQHILAEERLEMLILQIAKKLVTRSARHAHGMRADHHQNAGVGAHGGGKDAMHNHEPTSTASAQGKRSGSDPEGELCAEGSGGIGSAGEGSGPTGSGGSEPGGSGRQENGSDGDGSAGDAGEGSEP